MGRVQDGCGPCLLVFPLLGLGRAVLGFQLLVLRFIIGGSVFLKLGLRSEEKGGSEVSEIFYGGL